MKKTKISLFIALIFLLVLKNSFSSAEEKIFETDSNSVEQTEQKNQKRTHSIVCVRLFSDLPRQSQKKDTKFIFSISGWNEYFERNLKVITKNPIILSELKFSPISNLYFSIEHTKELTKKKEFPFEQLHYKGDLNLSVKKTTDINLGVFYTDNNKIPTADKATATYLRFTKRFPFGLHEFDIYAEGNHIMPKNNNSASWLFVGTNYLYTGKFIGYTFFNSLEASYADDISVPSTFFLNGNTSIQWEAFFENFFITIPNIKYAIPFPFSSTADYGKIVYGGGIDFKF